MYKYIDTYVCAYMCVSLALDIIFCDVVVTKCSICPTRILQGDVHQGCGLMIGARMTLIYIQQSYNWDWTLDDDFRKRYQDPLPILPFEITKPVSLTRRIR